MADETAGAPEKGDFIEFEELRASILQPSAPAAPPVVPPAEQAPAPTPETPAAPAPDAPEKVPPTPASKPEPKPHEATIVLAPERRPEAGPIESDTKVAAGKMLGHYLLAGLLAEGGMGKIWKAVDPFAGLEIRLLHNADSDTLIGALVGKAGVTAEDDEKARGDKVQAFVATRRLDFLSKSEEERKAIVQTSDFREYIKDDRVPRVVIKTLSDEYAGNPKVIQRFIKEINICKVLDHPNIVKVHEYGQHHGNHYAVMEFVDTLLLDKVKMTPEQATNVISKTLEGLLYAHDKGIIHRDIKPANILVSKDLKVVKLTDFGIAKVLDDTVLKDEKATGTGMIIGSPFFMSPEQARNEPVVDKSDVYSLGATFYKLVTGSPPVKGTSVMDTIVLVGLNKDPQWVREAMPDASEELEDVVMMMISKDLNTRLSTHEAKELLDGIIKSKRFSYRITTKEMEKETRSSVKTLLRENSSLGRKVGKATRDGKPLDEAYVLAQKYERLGELYARNEGIYQKVDVEKKEYRSARMDALEHAVAYYADFFRNKPGEKLTHEQLMVKKFTLPLLEKKVALEKRRMTRLEELGAIKPQRSNMKRAWVASAVAAGILGLGLGVTYFVNDHNRKSQITQNIVEVEHALQSKDYKLAYAKLGESDEEAKDYAQSHNLNKKLKELRVLVENSDHFDRASALYDSAKSAAREKSDFASARNSLEEALAVETKLSEDFKARLDGIKVESVSEIYGIVKKLLDGRKYSEASAGIEAVNWFLKKITPRNEEQAKLIESLKSRVKDDEPEITKRIAYIKSFQGMSDLLNTASTEYTSFETQLKADKFFKRADLNNLDEKLDQISKELLRIEPNAVGPEDYSKKEASVKEMKAKVQILKTDLDSRQVAHLSKLAKELGDYVNGVEDYTKEGVAGKVNDAKGVLEIAKGMYANMDQNADDFKAVQQKLTIIDGKLQDLDRKVTEYDVFLKVSKDGNADEKLTALASLVKIYIGVGLLGEAEKSLNGLTDRSGLDVYAKIIDLEKKVSEASQYVKRTPLGLDSSVIDSYSAVVEAYKADVSKGDKLTTSLLELYVKTNIDVKASENGIKEVKVLNDRTAELKELIKNDPKEEYKLELQEKEKSFAEKSGALHKVLGEYVSGAKTLLDAHGKLLPQADAVKQLFDAYKSAGYQKKADAVLERFK